MSQSLAIRGQQGFTLLELLLTTLLLALAIMVTGAALRGMWAGRERSERQVRLAEQRNAASVALRDRLSAITPTPFIAANGKEALFVGAPDRMIFAGSVRSYVGAGGVWRQVLEVIHSDEAMAICLRVAALRDRTTRPDCVLTPQTKVADRLKAVRFRYRGHDAYGALTDWRAEWTRSDALPEWIEVEVIPETGPTWPPIRVQVLLARSGGQ